MGIGTFLLDKLLQKLTKGREPRVGALYSLVIPPSSNSHSVSLRKEPRDQPDDTGSLRTRSLPLVEMERFWLSPYEKATFLVMATKQSVYIWDQWVNVLLCCSNGTAMRGWLPYHEFCRITLVNFD